MGGVGREGWGKRGGGERNEGWEGRGSESKQQGHPTTLNQDTHPSSRMLSFGKTEEHKLSFCGIIITREGVGRGKTEGSRIKSSRRNICEGAW